MSFGLDEEEKVTVIHGVKVSNVKRLIRKRRLSLPSSNNLTWRQRNEMQHRSNRLYLVDP